MMCDHDGPAHAAKSVVQLALERGDDLIGERLVAEIPADEAAIVVPAAGEALVAKPIVPIRRRLPVRLLAPRIVVPVHRADQRDVGVRQDEWPAIEIMETELFAQSRQMFGINTPRIA